jgi:hypothetical protein
VRRPQHAALGVLALIALVPGVVRASAAWRDGYCQRTADLRAPGMSVGTQVDEYALADSAAACGSGDPMWFRPRLPADADPEMLRRFLAGLPRWIATLAPGIEPSWRTRFPDADSRDLLPRAKRVQVRELAATDASVPWYPAADMGSREGIVRFHAILVVDTAEGRSELRMTVDHVPDGSDFRVYVQPEGRLAGQ